MLKQVQNKVHGALRASERYTKTDMVYLATGGFWLTVAQAISSLSALVLAIAFAHLLTQEAYGTYKYLLSIAGIFSIFALPGMNTAVSRATAQGNGNAIHAATAVSVMFGALGSLVALAGSLYYYLNHNIELMLALLIIAVTLPFFDTFTLYVSRWAGLRRFDLQAEFHGLTQAISVAVLITTAFFTNSVTFILLAYFIPLLVVRLTLSYFILGRVPKECDKSIEKETVVYGLHLTAMNILGVIAGNMDKILIWKFLGPVQVAVYTFAVAMPEQLKGPLKGVSDLAFPKFAKQTPEELLANLPALKRKLFYYALGLLTISLIYIVLAPYVFRILFPQYMESVFYSQVFILSTVGLVGTIPLAILGAQKKVREQYVFFTSQPLLQIVFYFLLIPFWGVMGAIIARIIMRAIYIVQSWDLLKRTLRGSVEQPS